jgi:hypothetical protein
LQKYKEFMMHAFYFHEFPSGKIIIMKAQYSDKTDEFDKYFSISSILKVKCEEKAEAPLKSADTLWMVCRNINFFLLLSNIILLKLL